MPEVHVKNSRSQKIVSPGSTPGHVIAIKSDGKGTESVAAASTHHHDAVYATLAHNHTGVYQPLNAVLTALAGLASAADKIGYFSGAGAAALADFTAAARTLLAKATALAQREALEVDNFKTWVIFDDFLGGTTTSGVVGANSWSFSNVTNTTASSGETDHPGVREITHAGGGLIGGLALGSAGLTTTLAPMSSINQGRFILRPKQTDANIVYRFGFTSNIGASPPGSGIYFEKLTGDGNWHTVTRASSSETRNDSGVAVADAWTDLKIVRNGGVIEFWINGVKTATDHSTTITALGMYVGLQAIDSSGGSRVAFLVDAVEVRGAAAR